MNSKKKDKKSLLKRITSFLVVLCMMCGFMVPLTSVTTYAAAPASYTTITTNSSASVNITFSGSAKYFKFVPTASGTYKFYSTNYTSDPYGALLDASGNTLTTNDDGGTDYNFSITYDCTANTTYYIKAVLGARTANIAFVYDGLKEAIKLNPSLAEKAANDLEFRKYAQDQTFMSIVNNL